MSAISYLAERNLNPKRYVSKANGAEMLVEIQPAKEILEKAKCIANSETTYWHLARTSGQPQWAQSGVRAGAGSISRAPPSGLAAVPKCGLAEDGDRCTSDGHGPSQTKVRVWGVHAD
jgi:hypothetical protein